MDLFRTIMEIDKFYSHSKLNRKFSTGPFHTRTLVLSKIGDAQSELEGIDGTKDMGSYYM